MRVTSLFLLLFLSVTIVSAKLPFGEIPPIIILADDSGAKIDGASWSSEELNSGKITILFYADPDVGEINAHVNDAVKAEKFPQEKFTTVAILNMAATWIPNAVISLKLKSKQRENKNLIYVKDLQKVLVKKWGLHDDGSNILLFGKQGEVLYSANGKLSEAQIQKLLTMIREKL
ncbi:MAG: transcriptional regulator [SAR324 cluster bacterium]|nr:transcriptional regulator [SAR324 cluster bacterium]